MYTTFFTQSVGGVNETYIVLSASMATSSYFVRPHGFGTDWKRIRIGFRFTFERAMAGTVGASYGFALQAGVCHGGGTGSYGLVTDNAYYCDLVPSATTYAAAAGANMAYWPIGTNVVSIKSTNGQSWYSQPYGANIYAPADSTAATRRVILVDIVSGSTFKFDFLYPASRTAVPDITKEMFYDIFGMVSSSFTNHVFAYSNGGTINGPTLAGTPMTMSHGQGALDSVFVALGANPRGPRCFITDFAVMRIA